MIQTNTLIKAQKIASFKRSLAVVIGINEYQNNIPKLQTARRDAEMLAEILAEEHQYDEVILITDKTACKPTLKNLLTLLEEKLLKEIQLTKDDRLLFYFAGHGIARDRVITLRSDFEPRFLNSEALKSYWTHARFPVRAMRSDELRQAIERPAAEMALYFEQLPGERNPVDKLVDEVGQMPGALPLLSFTLSELYIKLAKKWEALETSDRALTLDAEFDFEGGVAGSLTRRANKEYDSLPDDAHKDTMRRVMLRMVTIEGGESARRRVLLSELVYADKHDPSKQDDEENQRVELVQKRLIEARLIVSGQETGEPYVEPAHDFLVKSWDQLQKWQQKEQQDLLLQRRLTPNALEWKNEPQQEKKTQFLWNGNPYLEVLKKRLKSADYWFNQVESEFVQRSIWQRRRNTNLRWGIAISVMLGLSGLTILALIGQRNAQIAQIQAFQQTSEANLLSNQELDALISSLRAVKTLKYAPLLRLFKPDMQLQGQVRLTLQKAVYQVKERNHIKIPNDADKVVFSPNGQLLAIAQVNGTVSLWDRTGKQLSGFKPFNVGGQVWSLSFSPDSQQLITVNTNEIVKWWNLNGQQVGKDLKQPAGSVHQVMLGSNKRLMIFSDNKLRDLESGTQLAEFRDKGIGYDKFSPDGKLIATGVAGDTISILNVDPKKKIVKIENFPRFKDKIPVSISFSPDSKFIAAAGSQDDTVYLWDLKGNQLAKFKANQNGIQDISFSPDGKQLATIGIDGTLRIWQDIEGKKLAELSLDQDVSKISVSSDGQLLAASDRQRIILGNLRKRQISQFPQQFTDISELHFSPDNHLLAASEREGTIHLLNLENQQQLVTFNAQKYGSSLQGLSFSKDDNLLAIGGDNIITVRNRNGEQLVTFPEGTAPEEGDLVTNWVQVTAFDPSGNLLATSSVRGQVRLWNWKERKQILPKPIEANITRTQSIVFSPKGNLIATAGLDGSTNGVRLWNLSGEKLAEFKGHLGRVNQVIFSPDGNLLATAGDDGTARIWDLSGQELAEFKGFNGVESIAFSSDGKQLITARLRGYDPQRLGLPTLAELLQIEDLDELFVRGCKWAGDYLQNKPESDRDRHLCDDVPVSVTSQISTIPFPTTSPPTVKNFLLPLQAIAEDYYTRGREQADSKYINNFSNILAKSSTNLKKKADAYVNRGVIYYRQKKYALAIKDYEEALKIDPNNVDAYINRAIAYSSLQKPEHQRAIEDYEKALNIDPNNVDAYINRGIAYSGLGKHETAIKDYAQAIVIAPQNADAYYAKAFTQTLIAGKKQEAIENYRKAAKLYQEQNKPKYSKNALKKIEELSASQSS